MDRKETLERAVVKAIENGWEPEDLKSKKDLPYFRCEKAILFDIEFAKALFGEEPTICHACDRHHDFAGDCDAGFGLEMEHWAWQLQQMVIAEDPIKYLGDNI